MATIGFSFGMPTPPPQSQQQQGPLFGDSLRQSFVPAQAQGFGTTASDGGGGGGFPGFSTLALVEAGDLLNSKPNDNRSILLRTDNPAVLELQVPAEIVRIVEQLKNHVMAQKQLMMPLVNCGPEEKEEDKLFNCVAEQIVEVNLDLDKLSNLMSKQTLQTALLIEDVQKIRGNMDLISTEAQAWDNGSVVSSSAAPAPISCSSSIPEKFLRDLINNYGERLFQYKVEAEKVEKALQSIQGTLNVKDLWNTLTTLKDTVILLAGKIQILEEDLRKELEIHKKFT